MATQQVFIALQCSQCSTMQVKQQKKSSNKWVCAVCNQRQSVRKVFSRGHLARDVRGFVQRVNMSRRVAPPGADARASPPPPPGNGGCPRPRWTDWSEYLDPVEEDGFAADESNDVISGFPEVVTEMPTEMRSLPKRGSRNLSVAAREEDAIKPTFPKRKQKQSPQPHGRAHALLDAKPSVLSPSKFPSCLPHGKRQRVAAEGSSKWSEYLEDDPSEATEGEESSDPHACWGGDGDGHGRCYDLRFQEQVHPDFL